MGTEYNEQFNRRSGFRWIGLFQRYEGRLLNAKPLDAAHQALIQEIDRGTIWTLEEVDWFAYLGLQGHRASE